MSDLDERPFKTEGLFVFIYFCCVFNYKGLVVLKGFFDSGTVPIFLKVACIFVRLYMRSGVLMNGN